MGKGEQKGRGEAEWGDDREGKRRLRKKRKEGEGEKGGGREEGRKGGKSIEGKEVFSFKKRQYCALAGMGEEEYQRVLNLRQKTKHSRRRMTWLLPFILPPTSEGEGAKLYCTTARKPGPL